jgi:60 kDa SS-A/Ro ribonucleoprotein
VDVKLNTRTIHEAAVTHEGGPAKQITPMQELRRTVSACLLWESTFYEDGVHVADRIMALCEKVDPDQIAALAVEARSKFHLRHAPLLLLKALIKYGNGRLVSKAIEDTIQRADELAELVAVYWADGRKPLSNPMKKGLAAAFKKFSAHQLAKYNRDGAVKLRDVLFLCHAKPDTPEQAETWRALIEGRLASPDTWEVALSSGADKKATFERLIREQRLGYLALLRNLRNMVEAGVDGTLLKNAILGRLGAERVLPFRFVAAAAAAPSLEPTLDIALLAGIHALPQLSGKTIVLVDVSGSMHDRLSQRSDMTRMDAAAALASIVNCEDLRVFSFADEVVEVPPRRGLAGVSAIKSSQRHGGTYLGHAVSVVENHQHDRLIVITDEQSFDAVPRPLAERAYMINVGIYQNGVGYRDGWIHIDGFSENVIRFIAESESLG